MSEEEKKCDTPKLHWIMFIRTALGWSILVWMLYQHFHVAPVQWYMYGIPGALLGYIDPKQLLAAVLKK